MSALLKGVKFATNLALKNPTPIYTVTRNHWNKDFKPGPFPTTEEERIAAAKKYNLLPEEYRPYVEDEGFARGDYPHLPDVPTESLDPYYPYDMPDLKRNFGEPIHADTDFWSEDRYGSAEPLRYSLRIQAAAFLGVMGFCFALYYGIDDFRMFRPVLPKQYPHVDKVHYTFEPK